MENTRLEQLYNLLKLNKIQRKALTDVIHEIVKFCTLKRKHEKTIEYNDSLGDVEYLNKYSNFEDVMNVCNRILKYLKDNEYNNKIKNSNGKHKCSI